MGFSGLVILGAGMTLIEALRPFCDTPEVAAEVAYDEDGEPYNPDGKWDAFVIGGHAPLQVVARDGLIGEEALSGHGNLPWLRLGRIQKAPETAELLAGMNRLLWGSLWRCSRMPRDPESEMVLCDVARVDDIVALRECPWSILTPDGTWHWCDELRAAYGRGEAWWDAFRHDFIDPYVGKGCMAFFIEFHD